MKNAPTTNDELARMLKAGFDRVHQRFFHVHAHLDRIERRIDRILTNHERRIGSIEATLTFP
jgi:hypothetical protein